MYVELEIVRLWHQWTRLSTRRLLFDATTRPCLLWFPYRKRSSMCTNILCVSVQATYASDTRIFRSTRLYSLRQDVTSPESSNTSAIPSSFEPYFRYSSAFVYIPILRCCSNNLRYFFKPRIVPSTRFHSLLLAHTSSYNSALNSKYLKVNSPPGRGLNTSVESQNGRAS